MADETCQCCDDGIESKPDDHSSANRWLSDDVDLTTDLPDELRATVERFYGTDSIRTLGDWADAVRRQVDGDAVTIADLCVTDEETAHRATVDGDRYHFACFYDAVILAAITDRPVDIRTKSPNGATIEARAVGTDELTVTPETAVFSFGIDINVDPPSSSDENPPLERGYAAICPYVKAFPDRDAYERWAETVSAATIAMPLAGATDLAAALAG